jgi:hypothetical protein
MIAWHGPIVVVPECNGLRIQTCFCPFGACSFPLFFYLWLYIPFLDLGRFFSFLILYTVGRTPWTRHQPFARPLPTQTSMPWVGFEPTIPVFETEKTVHTLDRAATVIGPLHFNSCLFTRCNFKLLLHNKLPCFCILFMFSFSLLVITLWPTFGLLNLQLNKNWTELNLWWSPNTLLDEYGPVTPQCQH